MVTDALLYIVLELAGLVLSILPDISIDVTSGMYQTFTDIVAGVIYLLPMDTVLTIGSIILTLWIFKFFVALPKAIWEVLPFV